MNQRIYVCGPLSAESMGKRIVNVENAIDAGIELYERGFSPYIPHLTHFIDMRALDLSITISYETWLRTDLDWLALCHAVLALGHSPGTDRELAYAEAHGIPVYWRLEDIPAQLHEHRASGVWRVGRGAGAVGA